MDSSFFIAVEEMGERFPYHWPVLALYVSDRIGTESVVSRIFEQLQQSGVDVLVVREDGEKKNEQESPLASAAFFNVDQCIVGTRCCYIHAGEKMESCSREVLAPHISRYDLIFILADHDPADDHRSSRERQKGERSGTTYLDSVGDSSGDTDTFINGVLEWLQKKIYLTPLWACVLIGGKSSRMGRPKHLLADKDGQTWLEKTVATLAGTTDRVVLSGKGEIPGSLAHLQRLEDLPDIQGPLTGLLAAMRWAPQVSWLLAACDMPKIRPQGLHWLLSTRKPGQWGTVPRHPHTGHLEPLLALYDFRSVGILEKLLMADCLRIKTIGDNIKIASPRIPEQLAGSWLNCNTPEDLIQS